MPTRALVQANKIWLRRCGRAGKLSNLDKLSDCLFDSKWERKSREWKKHFTKEARKTVPRVENVCFFPNRTLPTVSYAKNVHLQQSPCNVLGFRASLNNRLQVRKCASRESKSNTLNAIGFTQYCLNKDFQCYIFGIRLTYFVNIFWNLIRNENTNENENMPYITIDITRIIYNNMVSNSW